MRRCFAFIILNYLDISKSINSKLTTLIYSRSVLLINIFCYCLKMTDRYFMNVDVYPLGGNYKISCYIFMKMNQFQCEQHTDSPHFFILSRKTFTRKIVFNFLNTKIFRLITFICGVSTTEGSCYNKVEQGIVFLVLGYALKTMMKSHPDDFLKGTTVLEKSTFFSACSSYILSFPHASIVSTDYF